MSLFTSAIEEAFDRYDTDRSGAIDASELTKLCSSLGVALSSRDVSTAMLYLDSDRSGRIEKAEFVRWWTNRRAGNLDLNGDGKVDAVESALGRASLAGTDEALRRHMEDMRFERDSLHREVVKLEEERVLTQRMLLAKQDELATLNARLQENNAAREEYDGIIRETEGAYRKILEGSAALLDMAVMWFWIFYRAKQDGPALLGLRHPWDAHGHDDHGHDDGHGHSEESH